MFLLPRRRRRRARGPRASRTADRRATPVDLRTDLRKPMPGVPSSMAGFDSARTQQLAITDAYARALRRTRARFRPVQGLACARRAAPIRPRLRRLVAEASRPTIGHARRARRRPPPEFAAVARRHATCRRPCCRAARGGLFLGRLLRLLFRLSVRVAAIDGALRQRLLLRRLLVPGDGIHIDVAALLERDDGGTSWPSSAHTIIAVGVQVRAAKLPNRDFSGASLSLSSPALRAMEKLRAAALLLLLHPAHQPRSSRG